MFNGFIGQYEHTIDEKGRITFPSLFRELLEEGAFILKGFDQNLFVMTTSRFQLLYDKINSLNMADSNTRQLRRLIFSNASQIEFDKNGRFIIPQVLREAAHLNGTALVLGIGKDVEIWDPATYKGEEAEQEGPESAAELVANFDLSI